MVIRAILVVILVSGAGFLMSSLLLGWVRSRFGLSHPSWTHAPAMGVLCVSTAIAVLFVATGNGEEPGAYINNVNQYPTFGRFLSYFVPIGILAIAVSVLIDELWARQEIQKTFNWASLLDEVAIGVMLMASYGRDYHFDFSGRPGTMSVSVTINTALAMLVAVMVLLAALLEALRRPAPAEQYVAAEDTSALEAELARRTAANERVSYFEGQNPAYLTVLAVVVCAASVFGAAMSWRAAMPWVSLLLLVIAGATTLVYGGIRVAVTSTLLDVRLGMLGVRLLTLPTAEISDVSVYPRAAGEGEGARSGKGDVRSLSFGGHRGVMVGTALGQQYLIGSDRPERLAAVLRTVTAGLESPQM